jgi:large subunit ribosomal protein L32
MPVPKRKSPQSATRKRVASAWTLKASPKSTCPNCGVVKVPHIVCSSCGHYKGRQAIDVE